MLYKRNLNNKILLTTAMGIFHFWGCFSIIPLPKEKPNDLKIEYYHGGGMSPYSVNFTIEEGKCTYILADMGNDHKITFPISEIQQKRIYKGLKSTRFSSIKSRKSEIVHDYPTTSLTVSAPSIQFEKEVRNSATQKPIKTHQNRFNQISEMVLAEAEAELQKHISIFKIEFQPSALEQKAELSVYKFFFSSTSKPEYLSGQLIPDTYTLHFYKRDTKTGNSKVANQVSMTVDKGIKRLSVWYKEGKFGVTPLYD